jgi:hypothetical protein
MVFKVQKSLLTLTQTKNGRLDIVWARLQIPDARRIKLLGLGAHFCLYAGMPLYWASLCLEPSLHYVFSHW